MIKDNGNALGAWMLLVGVILAVIVGILGSMFEIPAVMNHNSQIYAILILFGILIGFLNMRRQDIDKFMIAGVVLVIVSGYGMNSVSGSLIGFPVADIVKTVFGTLLTLLVPAIIIVALKSVFDMTKI
ncbi:MAG: hypothetical protein Q7R52_04030 [archaeon]|nr:hypothetical protein [archaeon]